MESKVGEINDAVVIYQMEKVDSGGAISDIYEEHMYYLADAWGFEIEDNENHPNYGEIRLPDGRHAGFTFQAFITTQEEEEKWREKDADSQSETASSPQTE